MKIGIRYCGGCSAQYDRGGMVKELAREFPDIHFSFDTNEYCNLWLIVCGCPSACARPGSLPGDEIRKFSSPKDFYRLKKELKERHSQADPSADKRTRLCCIGDSASYKKVFTQKDIDTFAALSGDTNGMHTDPDLARQGLFRRPVVHGVLVGSLLSTVMGTILPGNGTIFSGEEIAFLHPVYPGEEITAEVTFSECTEKERYYIGTFEGVCRNQDQVPVVRATCRQTMLKRFFKVEDPGKTAKSTIPQMKGENHYDK